uniref:ATP synthase complex subunit 8 n=1 Tax=Rhopalapion longirostre TaxID=202169 RepID=J9PJ27_9CUCU|nr:ATP synthase F0 subunit 8 [Rhopalapion longirostre]
MPQMMPLNWLFLFNIFVLTFILFNILNYFIFFHPIKTLYFKKKSILFNWKW